MWVLLAILSALCLGFYDICKKKALSDHSVMSVLTISLCCACVLLIPMFVQLPPADLRTHMFIFAKSLIVLSSWVFAYISVKHLPLSIVSPMQATRPMWTLLGAVTIYGEILNGWQWIGIVLALGSTFAFSFTVKGNKEGKNPVKFYICLLLSILIGASSGLYDKHMMRHFDHNTVQCYYILYQAIMMLIASVVFERKQLVHSLQHFSLSIPLIAVFLVLSDYVYFVALTDPDSMIAVVSTIRRGGTIIPFLYGILILREANPWRKLACLSGIILGLICLLFGTLA